ncbi:hypothetical protein LCGC14_2592430, partial [marine sediment metagenome]
AATAASCRVWPLVVAGASGWLSAGAAGALSSSQGVTSGNTFTLDAISITIRDAA